VQRVGWLEAMRFGGLRQRSVTGSVDRVKGREVGSGGVGVVAWFRKVNFERGIIVVMFAIGYEWGGEGELREHFISHTPQGAQPPPPSL